MAEQKKYRLRTDSEFKGPYSTFQIEALIDIPSKNVKAGDLGGWISSEKNLSHDGTCWVSDDALVIENAIVSEDAHIQKHAMVGGNATVSGYSDVTSKAKVGRASNIHNSRIGASALVEGSVNVLDSKIGGNTKLIGHAHISNSTIVLNNGLISDEVNITNSKIFGTNIRILNNVHVLSSTVGNSVETNRDLLIHELAVIEKAVINSDEQVEIGGNAQILEHAWVKGKDILINGMVIVKGHVRIRSHTSLKELVVVDGGDVKPTAKGYYDLDNAVINGDTHVIFPKTS